MVKVGHQVIKILGAGNYLMADDGVGVHILEKLEQMNKSDVELVNVGVGGLAILDYMEDADIVIIIDAVRGGGGEPGSIYKFTDKELPPANLFMMSLHDPVSYTHLRAHETPEHLVCRLLLEKK